MLTISLKSCDQSKIAAPPKTTLATTPKITTSTPPTTSNSQTSTTTSIKQTTNTATSNTSTTTTTTNANNVAATNTTRPGIVVTTNSLTSSFNTTTGNMTTPSSKHFSVHNNTAHDNSLQIVVTKAALSLLLGNSSSAQDFTDLRPKNGGLFLSDTRSSTVRSSTVSQTTSDTTSTTATASVWTTVTAKMQLSNYLGKFLNKYATNPFGYNKLLHEKYNDRAVLSNLSTPSPYSQYTMGLNTNQFFNKQKSKFAEYLKNFLVFNYTTTVTTQSPLSSMSPRLAPIVPPSSLFVSLFAPTPKTKLVYKSLYAAEDFSRITEPAEYTSTSRRASLQTNGHFLGFNKSVLLGQHLSMSDNKLQSVQTSGNESVLFFNKVHSNNARESANYFNKSKLEKMTYNLHELN